MGGLRVVIVAVSVVDGSVGASDDDGVLDSDSDGSVGVGLPPGGSDEVDVVEAINTY